MIGTCLALLEKVQSFLNVIMVWTPFSQGCRSLTKSCQCGGYIYIWWYESHLAQPSIHHSKGVHSVILFKGLYFLKDSNNRSFRRSHKSGKTWYFEVFKIYTIWHFAICSENITLTQCLDFKKVNRNFNSDRIFKIIDKRHGSRLFQFTGFYSSFSTNMIDLLWHITTYTRSKIGVNISTCIFLWLTLPICRSGL